MELKKIDLIDGLSIPFTNRTDKYGRAEFVVCSKYRRGRIVFLSIYPAQQENIKCFYEWAGDGRIDLTIGSFQNLDNAKIWLFNYCREHKCQSFRLYVPNGSNFLRVEIMSSISLEFTRTLVP